MAFKFAGPMYKSPERMGRYDINAPIRTAQARNAAIQKVANVANDWLQAEEAEALSSAGGQYKSETEKLKNDLLQQDYIAVDGYEDFDFSGVEQYAVTVKDPVTGQVQKKVPTWRVVNGLYDHEEKKIRQRLTGNLSGANRKKFDSGIADIQVGNANAINKKHYDDRHSHLKTQFENNYQLHVSNQDEIAANETIKQGMAVGAFSIAEAEIKYQQVGGEIDSVVWGRMISAAERNQNSMGLQTIAATVFTDPNNRMTGKQKLMVQEQAYTALGKIEAAITAQNEKAKKQASEQSLANLQLEIAETGKMPWANFKQKISNLEPDDQRTAITLNSNAKFGGTHGINQAPSSSIESRIFGLAIPIPGQNMDDRANSLRAEARRMTGIDQITGERVGPSLITNKEFNRLNDLIKEQSNYYLADPQIAAVEDQIYRSITRAGKSQFGMATNQVAAYELNEALKKYYTDAKAGGEQFNPNAWIQQNKSMVENAQYRALMADAIKDELDPYLVPLENNQSTVERYNYAATRKNIEEKIASGAIDSLKGAEYLNWLLDHEKTNTGNQ